MSKRDILSKAVIENLTLTERFKEGFLREVMLGLRAVG